MPRRKQNLDHGQRPLTAAPGDTLGRIQRDLDTLGLTHTRAHIEDYLAWAARDQVAPSLLLERIFAEQAAKKRELRVERRIALSGLREHKTLEAFNWAFQPTLDRSLIMELAELEFVRRAEDLIITGKSGTGKSHILQSFGLRACQQQFSVRYAPCVDLLDDLYAGLADGSYPDRLRRWCAPELLIIDDVGLGQVKKRDNEPTAAHTLFTLIDKRHARASTAITSNIDLSDWGRYLGDVTICAAILDRLAMRAMRIDISGPSYRNFLAEMRAKEHAAGKSKGAASCEP